MVNPNDLAVAVAPGPDTEVVAVVVTVPFVLMALEEALADDPFPALAPVTDTARVEANTDEVSSMIVVMVKIDFILVLL